MSGDQTTQGLAERMWALAGRWEARAAELDEFSDPSYSYGRPTWQRCVDYRRRASELRAELRAAGYERQVVQR